MELRAFVFHNRVYKFVHEKLFKIVSESHANSETRFNDLARNDKRNMKSSFSRTSLRHFRCRVKWKLIFPLRENPPEIA